MYKKNNSFSFICVCEKNFGKLKKNIFEKIEGKNLFYESKMHTKNRKKHYRKW